MVLRYLMIMQLVLCSFNSFTQELELDFEQALEYALKNNIEIQSANNWIEVTKASKKENIASFLPSVNVFSNATYLSDKQWNAETNTLEVQGTNTMESRITSQLILYSGMSRINGVKRASFIHNAQNHFIERIKQDIILLTTQQFVQILLDKELLTISTDNYQTQKLLLQHVESFFKEGLVPITEQYMQEALFKQSEGVLLNSENTLLSDIANLSLTLQIDPTTIKNVITPNWNFDKLTLSKYDFDALLSTALIKRSDYLRTQNLEDAAKINKKIVNADLQPELTLTYNYLMEYSSNNLRNNAEVPFRTQYLNDNLNSNVQLNLRIPIFNRLQVQTNRVTARVQHENNMMQTLNLKNTIFIEIRNAIQDFEAAQKNYSVTHAIQSATQKVYDLQYESYQLGLINLIDLSIENQRLLESKTNFIRAKYQLFIQEMVLKHTTGTLHFANLSN